MSGEKKTGSVQRLVVDGNAAVGPGYVKALLYDIISEIDEGIIAPDKALVIVDGKGMDRPELRNTGFTVTEILGNVQYIGIALVTSPEEYGIDTV